MPQMTPAVGTVDFYPSSRLLPGLAYTFEARPEGHPAAGVWELVVHFVERCVAGGACVVAFCGCGCDVVARVGVLGAASEDLEMCW